MNQNQTKQNKGELITQFIMQQKPRIVKDVSRLSKSEQKKKIDQPSHIKYNNQQLLEDELEKSVKLASMAERQIIQQQKDAKKVRVHDLKAGKNKTDLSNIIQNKSEHKPKQQNQIHKFQQKAEKSVVNNVHIPDKIKRRIPLTKDDIKELERLDKYRLLKIKNGQIRNKIGDLRTQMQHQYYEKKNNIKLPDHEYINNREYYSLNHPMTSKAHQFVNIMQQKQKMERKKIIQHTERVQQQALLNKQLQIEKKMIQKQQKKKQMEQLYNERKLKRMMQQQENERKKQEIKHWSKVFLKEKPLYIRKQEQYIENEIIPELYNKREKLYEIKMQRRQLNMEDIDNHQDRYLQFKRDNIIRHEAEIQIEKERHKKQQQQINQYYKGKYRYYALQQMVNQKERNQYDPRMQQKLRKARQMQYADETQSRIKDQIKYKKFKTLQLTTNKQYKKRVRKIDGSTSVDQGYTKGTSFTDPKVDGRKNLNFMKQLVREKGVKSQSPAIKIVAQKNIYHNYLPQVRDQRRKSLNFTKNSQHDNQNQMDSQNVGQLIKIQQLNSKLKKNEQRKKNLGLDYKQDAQFEINQLQAVKLKLKLIQQMN